MICAMFRNMVDLYAEGRLAGFQAEWMERHTASCPRCAAELAAWKRMFAQLSAIPSPQAPSDLKEMLRAALAGGSEEEARSLEEEALVIPHGRAWEPSMALAAGLLALALSSSISAIGPGVQSQGYPDKTVSHVPRG